MNMKKHLLLFVFMLVGMLLASAQEVRSVRPSARENAKKSAKTWNRDFAKGYRGFIDFGRAFVVGPNGGSLISASTSHGYQFSPYYYLGAGVGYGYNFYVFALENSIPLFANFRTNLLNTRISPFIDFKIGYSLGENKGFYMYPAIGGSFLTSRKFGWNIAVGYDMQVTKPQRINWPILNTLSYEENVVIGGITIKAGIEF